MSEHEQWFNSLNANGKTIYFLGNEHKVSKMAWDFQQAEIDRLSSVLDERTKEWLQAIKCGTYFENVAKPLKEENDRLKVQLKDIEACYIEKKREVEELQGRIDASKSSQPKLHKTEIGDCLHFSTTMFHDGKATCFDCDAVVNHKREVIGVMQTKAVRGGL